MIKYSIDPSDYLTYQLYMASNSKEVKSKRRRNWLLVPLIYLLFAALAYFLGNQKNIALVFSILAALWLVLNPLYTRWTYKDRFRKAIINNNKEMFGKNISLKIENKNIIINDTQNSSTTALTQIKSIHEITSHFFIKLEKGSSLIIPKSHFTKDNSLKKLIQEISSSTGIQVSNELNWKWK